MCIRDRSTCLSNVPEESSSNVCGIRDSRRIRESFLEVVGCADCVKAAVNYVVHTGAKTQLGTFWSVSGGIHTAAAALSVSVDVYKRQTYHSSFNVQ